MRTGEWKINVGLLLPVFASVFAMGLVPMAAASPPDSALAAVEARMRAEVDAGKLPSVAYALIKDGKMVREGAFGMADRERGIPATARTPYPLASVTKPLVATAAMMLAQRNELDLSQPAVRYLPEAAHAVPGNVEQLLSHTSGLTTYARIDWTPPNEDSSPVGRPAGPEPWAYAFAAQPPGTLFEYANLGYGIVGRIIEARTNRRLGDYLSSELFAPLGMRDSSLPDGFAVPVGGARKCDVDGRPLPPSANDTPGAGNAWASAHDLALFAAFHVSANESEILSRENRQRMQTHARAARRYDYYGGAGYGLGWYVSEAMPPSRVVWHEGGMPGASSIIYMLPGQRAAAVVLINRTDANDSAQQFAQALIKAVEPGFLATPLNATQGFQRYAGTEDLRGRWRGEISVDGRSLPWALSFGEDGLLSVELPGHPGAGTSKTTGRALVREGLVLGAFEGGLPALGTTSGEGRYVLLRLLHHENQITGALVAYAAEQRLEYLLPYRATLRREPVGTSGLKSGSASQPASP